MPREDGQRSLPLITAEQLLRQIRTDSWRQCEIWGRRARRWRLSSVILGLLAMFGSGAAGAIIISGVVSSTDRTIAIVLAFVGAALSGVAAAAGAPYQAREAGLRSDRLAALHRWTWFALADMPKLSNEDASQLVRNILDWNDEISGVSAPVQLRQGVSAVSDRDHERDGHPAEPQWDMAL